MALRRLAERSRDGIVVELFWNDSAPPGTDVLVEYRDERRGVFFTLHPPRDRALEAFYHPNAYAGTDMTTSHSRAAPSAA
jgi:hypothetical protein